MKPASPASDPSTSQTAATPFLVGKLALRIDDVAAALGVSRRAIERERSAGRFPKPDRHIGKMPLWLVETVRRWLEGGEDR